MNCCDDFGQCTQGDNCPVRTTTQQPLISCVVKVNGQKYTGLFPSTFDAISDAQTRYPSASRITAQVSP